MMNDLYKIHSFYKFSLDSFVIVVKRAIDIVAAADRAKAKAAAGGGEGGEGAAEGEEAAAEGEEAAAEEPKADDAAAEGEGEEIGEIVEMTPKTLAKRVDDLTESITYQAFNYTRRGTFEQHKLTLSTMLTFKILARNGRLNQAEIDHLVKKRNRFGATSPTRILEIHP